MIVFQVQDLKTKEVQEMSPSEMVKTFPNASEFLLSLDGVTRVFIREDKKSYLCKRRLS